MILRIVIILLGIGFLLIGFSGLFRPAQLAEALALMPVTPAGTGSLRAMIGAHYLAMGSVAIVAALSKRWAWLVPLACIEGCMVLARGVSGIAGELDPSSIGATGIEVIACVVLALGATMARRNDVASSVSE